VSRVPSLIRDQCHKSWGKGVTRSLGLSWKIYSKRLGNESCMVQMTTWGVHLLRQ